MSDRVCTGDQHNPCGELYPLCAPCEVESLNAKLFAVAGERDKSLERAIGLSARLAKSRDRIANLRSDRDRRERGRLRQQARAALAELGMAKAQRRQNGAEHLLAAAKEAAERHREGYIDLVGRLERAVTALDQGDGDMAHSELISHVKVTTSPEKDYAVHCCRCHWDGFDSQTVGEATHNCPKCGSTWEVTEGRLADHNPCDPEMKP